MFGTRINTDFFSGVFLFVLYRCRRLRRVIDQHAVNARYLGRNAVHKVIDQLCRKMLNSHFHDVGRIDRADDTGPVEGPLPIRDAGRFEIGNDSKILPDLSFQPVLCELFTEDRVRFTDSFQTVARDGSGAAHAKARTRERLTVDHIVRETKLFSDDTDFILKEDTDRLNELELQIFRKSARVMMRLDAGFAFQNVRPDGALRKELDPVKFPRLFRKLSRKRSTAST